MVTMRTAPPSTATATATPRALAAAPVRRARSLAPLLAVLGLLVLAGVAPAPAVAASVRDVQLTQDGPVPARLTVGAGDSVRFVNVDTFVHRVVSDSSGWAFDSRTIFPGRSFTVTPALTKPGTYAYRGAGLDSFTGTVVVPGAVASASPKPSPRASSA
ncbi:MAG: Copper binding protein plastocyanin/azurin family, partial [Frankiales bacterium]|nr:Copper binding protein plastocyanin/azurin family [Frankiales bacterium]